MGVLDFTVSTANIQKPDFARSDFEDGLKIVEIENGVEKTSEQVVLVGVFMPKDSFKFGGAQRNKKTYYAGSSEPSVQILGPTEDDITIKGTFNLKKITDLSVYTKGKESAALEFQELVDAMRLRGNIVKITLGEWKRYGLIDSCNFDLRTLADIDYEIKFTILGFNMPKNYYLIDGSDGDFIAPNKALTDNLTILLVANENKSTDLPRSVSDTLNSIVSDVAAKVALVTNFVNGVIGDAEKITAAAKRGVGLIQNARAFVSQANRRVGAISKDINSIGPNIADESQKLVGALRNIQHLNEVERQNTAINKSLSDLQSKFAAFISTIPLKRHLVKVGDTLQKISVTYYGTPDNWKKIMDQNKLTSSVLVQGSVLEIPKV